MIQPHLGGKVDATNVDLEGRGGHGKLLRLIVVGINSFNQHGTFTGNGNNTPHMVFQFQNIPTGHTLAGGPENTYAEIRYYTSQVRNYLIYNFLPGLIEAGVPDDVLWAPSRRVANKVEGATGADIITDKLWLPTEWEMFGSTIISNGTWENAGNQGRLAYYANNESRVKYTELECYSPYYREERGSPEQLAYWYTSVQTMSYWLASPRFEGHYSYANAPLAYPYVCVGGDYSTPAGGAYLVYPQHWKGIAPAFCVK
jgi:hypothetical protein